MRAIGLWLFSFPLWLLIVLAIFAYWN